MQRVGSHFLSAFQKIFILMDDDFCSAVGWQVFFWCTMSFVQLMDKTFLFWCMNDEFCSDVRWKFLFSCWIKSFVRRMDENFCSAVG
jgi:hypothetical protein